MIKIREGSALLVKPGVRVLPRKGSDLRRQRHYGKTTGHSRSCHLEGCGGHKLQVVWPDGKKTWCCVKGMNITSTGHWEIL